MGKIAKERRQNIVDLVVKLLRLDGVLVTATATELNKLAGATVTTAEINKLAGVTGGTVSASKAIVTDANGAFKGQRKAIVDRGTAVDLTTAESGAVIRVTAANLTLGLPATAAGLNYTVVLAAGALSTGAGLALSPVAADKIMGNGFTATDNKDAILAGANDREGDTITLVADGVDGWYITAVTGTWTREA